MFNRGSNVVCVHEGRDINLVNNNIYTVVESALDSQGEECVMLLEVEPPEPFLNYLSWRFRKATTVEALELEKSNKVTI